MVSQELLDILRCPNCVRDGPQAGMLVNKGNWLICADCDRKYPIRDDIPVMLIQEGTRFQSIPVEELPETPPPEKRLPLPAAPDIPSVLDDRQKLIVALVGAALGVGLIVFIMAWLKKKKSR